MEVPLTPRSISSVLNNHGRRSICTRRDHIRTGEEPCRREVGRKTHSTLVCARLRNSTPARKATVRSRFTDAGGLPPPCPFLAARTQTIAIFYRHEAQTQASFVSPNLLLGSRPLLGISLSLTLPLPLPKSFRRPEGKEKIPKEELFSIIQNVPMFAKRATTEEQLNVSRHCISNNPACTHSVTHYPPAFTHTHTYMRTKASKGAPNLHLLRHSHTVGRESRKGG